MKFKLANGWTKEKVMEQVKKYNDGTRAITLDGACTYANGNNNRCAIGCFIPDNHKALTLNAGVTYILENFPDLKKYMPFDNAKALNELQSTHDNCFDINVHESIQMFLDTKVE